MQKVKNIFICTIVFLLFNSVSFAISPSSNLSLTVIPPEPPTENPTFFVNSIMGMMTWIGYVIALVLIVFGIIKGIVMIVKKKPIGKAILFMVIMLAIAFAIVFFVSISKWVFMIGS